MGFFLVTRPESIPSDTSCFVFEYKSGVSFILIFRSLIHLKSKTLTKILIIILSFIASYPLLAKGISGKVVNQHQEPIAYVNIGVVGLNKGTISSKKGMFTLNLKGLDQERTVRFSSVGYESVDFNVGELQSRQNNTLNVTLVEKKFELPEVTVIPMDKKPIYLGAKRAGKMAWVWSEAIQGAEIATLFRNDTSICLKKFQFHVRKNYCDSILYRIKIYDGEDEYPRDIINEKDIRFTSTTHKGWESVDISNEHIVLHTDFIISLETLESWTSSTYRTTHLSVGKTKGGLSYSRASSMAPWKEFGNPMSFKVEIMYIEE